MCAVERDAADPLEEDSAAGVGSGLVHAARSLAAIDEALAAQPDVLEKIRDGKVQAAGAVIGAVMKSMKGQADAARVRELVLERAGSAGG